MAQRIGAKDTTKPIDHNSCSVVDEKLFSMSILTAT